MVVAEQLGKVLLIPASPDFLRIGMDVVLTGHRLRRRPGEDDTIYTNVCFRWESLLGALRKRPRDIDAMGALGLVVLGLLGARKIVVAFEVQGSPDRGRLDCHMLLLRQQSLEVGGSALSLGTKHQHLLHQPLNKLVCEHCISPAVVILVLLRGPAGGTELSEGSPHYFPVGVLAFHVVDLRGDVYITHLVDLPHHVHPLLGLQAQAEGVDGVTSKNHTRAGRR